MVWTVNDPLQMIEAVRWNVAVIITDKPKDWVDLRNRLSGKAQAIFGAVQRYLVPPQTMQSPPLSMGEPSSGPHPSTTGRRTCSLVISSRSDSRRPLAHS
jgi:hypothetical protein